MYCAMFSGLCTVWLGSSCKRGMKSHHFLQGKLSNLHTHNCCLIFSIQNTSNAKIITQEVSQPASSPGGLCSIHMSSTMLTVKPSVHECETSLVSFFKRLLLLYMSIGCGQPEQSGVEIFPMLVWPTDSVHGNHCSSTLLLYDSVCLCVGDA